MRCESGSVKRGGNEIGCASSESGAQPIDLFRMTDALEDPGAKWVAICGAVLNR